MKQVLNFPANRMSPRDRQRLESFGGHSIARGRATRWSWAEDVDGDEVFHIFRGGPEETLAVRISRENGDEGFMARDGGLAPLASGSLGHVLAVLDDLLTRLHGELPDGEPPGSSA
jgi:hypothetical protein